MAVPKPSNGVLLRICPCRSAKLALSGVPEENGIDYPATVSLRNAAAAAPGAGTMRGKEITFLVSDFWYRPLAVYRSVETCLRGTGLSPEELQHTLETGAHVRGMIVSIEDACLMRAVLNSIVKEAGPMSKEEIGSILGLKASTVNTIYHRAMNKLKRKAGCNVLTRYAQKIHGADQAANTAPGIASVPGEGIR